MQSADEKPGYNFDNLDDDAAQIRGEISARVEAMKNSWQWNREEEVKNFPPEVQKYLLKDWEPGKL